MIRSLAQATVASLALAIASAALAEDAVPAPQQSSAFTADQIEALHAEIRAYLLANPEIVM